MYKECRLDRDSTTILDIDEPRFQNNADIIPYQAEIRSSKQDVCAYAGQQHLNTVYGTPSWSKDSKLAEWNFDLTFFVAQMLECGNCLVECLLQQLNLTDVYVQKCGVFRHSAN
jgi:hypothetical protein